MNKCKIEWQLRAFEIFAVIKDQSTERQVDFADENALGGGIKHRTHFRNQLMNFRLVGIVERQVSIDRRLVRAIIGIWWIVTEVGVFNQKPKDVYPKAINAATEPKLQHPQHRIANLRIPPVQIGLLRKETVQIKL